MAVSNSSSAGTGQVERRTRARRIIAGMCLAEALSMLGAFSFPTLLPQFFEQWGLSTTQAGWINGVYFAGYTVAVPVLAGLTDRLDGRTIYLFSAVIGGISALGFSWGAEGFWSAMALRTLGGLGLAGTFIPGLKALVDRLDGPSQARAVAFYTAVFSLGMSLSFLICGWVGERYGWRAAFLTAGFGTILAAPAAAAALGPARRNKKIPQGHFLDFRFIVRNRPAMTYILSYAAHMWEMFTFRSWMVAFLAFCLELNHQSASWLTPSAVAALAGLAGMWASVGGAEMSLRLGRNRVLTAIMGVSAVIGCLIGFTAGWPYPAVAGLCVLYTLFLQGDSAALHTGVILSADPQRRGATMAFQSLLGFGAAALGPLSVGWLLDLTGGGRTPVSWGLAFIGMGAVVALGPLFMKLLGGENPSGVGRPWEPA